MSDCGRPAVPSPVLPPSRSRTSARRSLLAVVVAFVLATVVPSLPTVVGADGTTTSAVTPGRGLGTPAAIPTAGVDDPLAVAAVSGDGRQITIRPVHAEVLTTSGNQLIVTWGDPAASMTRVVTTIGATPPSDATVERGAATTFAPAGRTPVSLGDDALTVTLPHAGSTVETSLWVQTVQAGRSWTSPLYDFGALTSRPQPTAEPGTRAEPVTGANPATAAFVPATTTVSVSTETVSVSFTGTLPTRAAGQPVRSVTDVVELRPAGQLGPAPFELRMAYAEGRMQAYRAGDPQPLPFPAGPSTTNRDGSPARSGAWFVSIPKDPQKGAYLDVSKAPLEAVLGTSLDVTTIFGLKRVLELADGTVWEAPGVSQLASPVATASDPATVAANEAANREKVESTSSTRRWWMLGLGVLFAAILVWGLVLLWPHVRRTDFVQRRKAKRRDKQGAHGSS